MTHKPEQPKKPQGIIIPSIDAGEIAGKHKKVQNPSEEVDLHKHDEYPEESFESRFTRITMHKFLRGVIYKPYLDEAILKTKIVFLPDMEVYRTGARDIATSQPSINYIWTSDVAPIMVHGTTFRVLGPGQANMRAGQTIGDHLEKNYALSKSKTLVRGGISVLSSIIQSGVPDTFEDGEYLIAGVCFDVNKLLMIPAITVHTETDGTKRISHNALKMNTIIQNRKFLAEQRPRPL
jgi:hypothetical protein